MLKPGNHRMTLFTRNYTSDILCNISQSIEETYPKQELGLCKEKMYSSKMLLQRATRKNSGNHAAKAYQFPY